jgi:hypothetical protein
MKNNWPKYIVVDSLGWPVVGIIGRPVISFFRKIIHGRGIITRETWLKFEAQRRNSNNSVGAYSPAQSNDGSRPKSLTEPLN